jgi:K+-sensing histidine kinase KdpD
MGPRCSSAETQVCHRSYIIAANIVAVSFIGGGNRIKLTIYASNISLLLMIPVLVKSVWLRNICFSKVATTLFKFIDRFP